MHSHAWLPRNGVQLSKLAQFPTVVSKSPSVIRRRRIIDHYKYLLSKYCTNVTVTIYYMIGTSS